MMDIELLRRAINSARNEPHIFSGYPYVWLAPEEAAILADVAEGLRRDDVSDAPYAFWLGAQGLRESGPA